MREVVRLDAARGVAPVAAAATSDSREVVGRAAQLLKASVGCVRRTNPLG